MKIFVYKVLISAFVIFLLYQLTIGYTISKFQQKISTITNKENLEMVKDKVRNEMKAGLEKDKILKDEDAILLREFLKKINSELNNIK